MHRRISPISAIRNHLSMMNPKQYQFSLIEFAYWAAASAIAFTVVYLQEKELSSASIGVVMALLNALGIIAPPIWGMVSDKVRSVKKTLIICLIGASIVYALVPLSTDIHLGTLSAVFIILPLSAFFRIPTTSLLDTWLLTVANREKNIVYGHVRLWGSIGYGILAIVMAQLTTYLGSVYVTFLLYGLLNLPMILLCIKQKDEGDVTAKKKLSLKEMHFEELFSNYYLMSYFAFNTLVYLPVYGAFTFLPYILLEVAGNTDATGVIMGLKAFMEVPMLFASALLIRRFNLRNMLFVGAVMFTLEQSLYVVSQSLVQVTLISLIHGLAYGIYLACTVNYVHRLAPPQLTATAQTINGALGCLSGIIGNLIGGFLVDSIGVRGYYAIAAGIECFALIVFVLSFVIGKYVFHKELPASVLRLDIS